jgi:chaperonin cofactor prefoldin
MKECRVHWLTKAFVLAAAVLAVLLSALTIAYSSNADKIVGDYYDEQARRTSAEALAQGAESKFASERAEMNAKVAVLGRDITSLQTQVSQLQSENAKLLLGKNSAEDERRLTLSKLDELQITARTQASLIQSYRDETTTLRGNEQRSQREKNEMGDRISDLEAKREVLEQSLRSLQEQLAEARTGLENALSGATASKTAAGSSEAFTFSGPIIRGRVDEVGSDAATGSTLVKVNVGSADNVRDGMKFYVVRGNEFVGTLTVVKTDLKHAIAKVTLTGGKGAVTTSDMVLSRIGNN